MVEEAEREEEGVKREELTKNGTMEDTAETPTNMEILVILQPAGPILIFLISASVNMWCVFSKNIQVIFTVRKWKT